MITPLYALCEACGHEDHPQLFDTHCAERTITEDGGSDAMTFRGTVTIAKTLHCPLCGAEVAASEPEPFQIEKPLTWA